MHDEPERTPELGPDEAQLAERLSGERPLPAARFRGALGRYLAARDPGYGPRPERLRLIVLSYLAGGTALLGVAALVAVGAF